MSATDFLNISNPLPLKAPKEEFRKTCNKFLNTLKTITIIALQIIGLTALLLFQPFIFSAGFAVGLVTQLAAKDWLAQACDKIQAAIGNRPWLFAGITILATVVVPEWLFIGPPLIGGIYGGIQFAKLCQ